MSTTAVLAQFAYPFRKMVSPFADELDQQVNKWLSQYDCLNSHQKAKLRRGRFGNLAAHFFPLATFQQLIFMARWNLAFFAFDDTYGPLPLDELKVVCKRATAILQGDPVREDDNEIFRQIGILRQELLAYATPSWMEQFIHSMQLFFEGMQIDTKYSYQEKVNYPTIAEYIEIREKIVATYPLLDMVEMEINCILPRQIIADPFIHRIRQLACRLVSWSNDVYSLDKELKDHEAMNLVLVIQHEEKCSLEEAIERAVLIHDEDLCEFVDLLAALPHYGKYNREVREYVRAVGLLLQGHILWYNHTKRY